MRENFRKIEEACKEKFNEGSFGILTPIFNPAYPSLKYVIPTFILIRTIFYICTFSLNDSCIHLEFFMGLILIIMSLVVNASFESGYTVEAEFMSMLMPLIGLIVFTTPLTAICGVWENVSDAYYKLFGIDLIFFFYTVYIRVNYNTPKGMLL